LNNKLSNKDRKDWKKFIKNKDKLENKDEDSFKSKKFYIERTIDLHGYTLENANKKIDKFINKCFFEGVNKINIITGKGLRSKNKNDPFKSEDLSLLKFSIPDFIKNNSNLMEKIHEIDLNSVDSKMSGSFYIILKKKSD
tara:strand:+ start:180 stop:599 length:420 start_codon:yes stop_codon:yes gene_type:complete